MNRQGSAPKRPGYEHRCHWHRACLLRGDRQREGFSQRRQRFQSAAPEQRVRTGIRSNNDKPISSRTWVIPQSSILRPAREEPGVRLKPPAKPPLDPGALIVRKGVVGIVNATRWGSVSPKCHNTRFAQSPLAPIAKDGTSARRSLRPSGAARSATTADRPRRPRGQTTRMACR